MLGSEQLYVILAHQIRDKGTANTWVIGYMHDETKAANMAAEIQESIRDWQHAAQSWMGSFGYALDASKHQAYTFIINDPPPAANKWAKHHANYDDTVMVWSTTLNAVEVDTSPITDPVFIHTDDL